MAPVGALRAPEGKIHRVPEGKSIGPRRNIHRVLEENPEDPGRKNTVWGPRAGVIVYDAVARLSVRSKKQRREKGTEAASRTKKKCKPAHETRLPKKLKAAPLPLIPV